MTLEAHVQAPSRNERVVAFIQLMKLRVVELLLVSTLPALVLAYKGVPPIGVSIATLIGGTLAAGAANAYNMVIESDLDKLMTRTSNRPLVTGVISRKEATVFATVVATISLAIFWFFTTTLATLLALFAIAFYVLVYTVLLKPRTTQNIVWGGIAGCMPVLIGWAAITNSLSWTAVSFFLVIFFWTPPHFWSLAIKFRDDYQAAGFPMLPVVAPKSSVRLQMWFHTSAMIISSVAVVLFAELPLWTLLATLALGFIFAFQLLQLNDGAENYSRVAGKIFQWSISYLSLFSVLLVAGQLIS